MLVFQMARAQTEDLIGQQAGSLVFKAIRTDSSSRVLIAQACPYIFTTSKMRSDAPVSQVRMPPETCGNLVCRYIRVSGQATPVPGQPHARLDHDHGFEPVWPSHRPAPGRRLSPTCKKLWIPSQPWATSSQDWHKGTWE